MIGFLHPEPSPPPPVANCVTSTQWCVTSTSGLIIAPVNAATLLPLLLDSIESPPSTDCPTSALARNHQIVCPSDRCLPPWHCQPHPSSYFAEIFQPSTFGMAPLPKTYHSCHSPGCQIGLLSNFTRAGLHAAKYFKDQTRNTNTLEWLPPNNVPLQSLLHVNIILCLPHRARDSTNPTDTATRFTP